MELRHVPDLTLIDFVGVEESEEIDRNDPLSVLAVVCNVALKKNIEWYNALKRREESKKPVKKESEEIQRKRTSNPPSRFWFTRKEVYTDDHIADKKGKKISCDDERPCSSGSMGKRARRCSKPETEGSDTGVGSSSCSGSLALQVTKMEYWAESYKRKRNLECEEEQCYNPEPISMWPPRDITGKDSIGIVDYDTDDGVERSYLRKKKKKQANKPKKPRPPKPPTDTGPDNLDLSENFKRRIEEMGGRNWLLVLQKRFFYTDLTKGHNRLSIPINSVKNGFLTEHEKTLLHSKPNVNPMDVKLIDETDVWDIKLRKWDMTKNETSKVSSSYVLTNPWYSIVVKNNWLVGDLIQLWAFRIDGNLAFAIVKVIENEANENAEAEQ